jgi:hypothetical protein
MNVGQWANEALGAGAEPEQTDNPKEGGAKPADIAANPPDLGVADLIGWEEEKLTSLREASPESPEGMTPNPPTWVTDEGAWNRAKAAVEKYWGNYSEPWAVVAHVYNMTGG